MTIRNAQDFATGLFFIAVGALAYWIGADYNMGTPRTPGTGVLPRIIAWGLMATGGVLTVKSLIVAGPRLTQWAWQPLLAISAAVVAFGLSIDPLGLVVTMVVSMTIAALGSPETRWREFAWFTLLMVVLGVGVFIYGLGMPIKVTPWESFDQLLKGLGTKAIAWVMSWS